MNTMQHLNGNCKVTVLNQLNQFHLHPNSIKSFLQNLATCNRITVFLHLTDTATANFVMSNFPVLYKVDVPIGYNDTYQYHILIVNFIRESRFYSGLHDVIKSKALKNIINKDQWEKSSYNPINKNKKEDKVEADVPRRTVLNFRCVINHTCKGLTQGNMYRGFKNANGDKITILINDLRRRATYNSFRFEEIHN